MSVGKGNERKLLTNSLQQQQKQPDNESTYHDGEETVSPVSSSSYKIASKQLVTYYADENRNSIIEPTEIPLDIIPTNLCEVTTTEIIERKVKKKSSSAITSLRNFVRASVQHSPPEDEEVPTKEMGMETSDFSPGKSLRRRKSRIKKRSRRSRDINNAGASLWKPTDHCCWRSVDGRSVYLDDVTISDLSVVELDALKQICLQWFTRSDLYCTVSIPKEQPVRRKWKQILHIGKKEKSQDKDPQNPVFSVNLMQVIENDKTVDKAHQIAMRKLGAVKEEALETNSNTEKNNRNKLVKQNEIDNEGMKMKYTDRRKSDPSILERNFSFTSQNEYEETQEYLNRRIDTLREEDEEEGQNIHRRSRLIEALTLSSISASSTCVLNKESEFTPFPPQVPKVIKQSVDYIERYALNTPGIFRTGGSKKRVRQMREDFDNGHTSVITKDSNPHDVAALFKEFLRSLPEPLLTRELYCPFLAAAKLKENKVMAEVITYLVRILPSANRDTLKVTLNCLAKVAESSNDKKDDNGNIIQGNKMDTKNLATLMAPNILHRLKNCKSPSLYQTDVLNPEDNKAAIDVVNCMIESNNELFKIPGILHDQILKNLVDEEPELVDFVLRKKASRKSFAERPSHSFAGNSTTITTRSKSTGTRPISGESRNSYDEVSFFQKSYSFNQGPYKRIIRSRKESAYSRPVSSKSDPPDRNSVRRSNLGTPPERRRMSNEVKIPKKDSNSPRDSGVVLNTTPTFQRNSLARSSGGYMKNSPLHSPSVASKQNIKFRKQSRDRESRDSAYESGVSGVTYSVRCSNPPASIHLDETEGHLDDNKGHLDDNEGHHESTHSLLQDSSEEESKLHSAISDNKIDYINDVLSQSSFLRPDTNHANQRKISLPTFSTTSKSKLANKTNLKPPTKSNSMDTNSHIHRRPVINTKVWDIQMSSEDVGFLPSPETTL